MGSQESFDAVKSKDENSIISEEDSLFEDQTPAGRDNKVKDHSQLNFQIADQQAQKPRSRSKRKQPAKKTKSMNEEDNMDQDIVQRKEKAKR